MNIKRNKHTMGKHGVNQPAKFRYIALVLLVIFFLAGAFILLRLWERGQGNYSAGGNTTIEKAHLEYEGKRYTMRKDIETFLMLGLDTFEEDAVADSYNNNKRADFLLLFIIDHSAEKVTALQINRDTMAKMNVLGVAGQPIDRVTKQIALAHTYGNGREVSCRNTADAVSDLLYGTKVMHYISLTMDAVPIYTDLVDGIEITVLDDFSTIDETLQKGATLFLTGEQVLTYVRTRGGLEDSSNINRMERQKQVLTALYEASASRLETDSAFVLDAVVSLSDHMVSDRSATQLQELVNTFSAYEFTGIVTPEGESRVGEDFMEFTPDEDALKELLISLMYEAEA